MLEPEQLRGSEAGGEGSLSRLIRFCRSDTVQYSGIALDLELNKWS